LSEQLSLGVTQQFSPEGAQAYTELLYRVLEDGCITECEGKDLIALAKDWGLSWECVSRIHRAFVQELVQAASADGRLSQAEQVHIASVARLLSLGEYSVEQFATLSPPLEDQPIANRNTTATQDWRGKSVCFTGECSCRLHNELITRELAEEMAADRGLIVKPSVTKKLDLLVVSDPHTQSGKAKKAREYGIRIIWEPLFWRSLGIDVD
jgi:DNA polymerase-3 subunit epsilon